MAKGKRKKSKKKIFIFGGLGLLVVVVILLSVFSGDKEKIVSVQTEKIEKRTVTQIVSANGTIKPVDQVVLRPEVTGEVVELPVKEGDKVSRGQQVGKVGSSGRSTAPHLHYEIKKDGKAINPEEFMKERLK